jgi:hypothetical protein
MTDKEARARWIDSIIKLTVWIRQRHDGQWEAIDWTGNVVAFNKYRASCEHDVRQKAADPSNGIYAYAIVVEPKERQPKRRPKGTRRVY